MSNSKWTYIGPYLKLAIPKTTTQRTGPVPCCGQNPVGRFCAHCGKAAEFIATPVVVDAVRQGDLAQQIDERLMMMQDCTGHDDGFDYWMPNGAPDAWKLPDADETGHGDRPPYDRNVARCLQAEVREGLRRPVDCLQNAARVSVRAARLVVLALPTAPGK